MRSTTIRKRPRGAVRSRSPRVLLFSVNEVEQTRKDGNIIKLTEYDLSNDKYDARISNAVRTHTDKNRIAARPPPPPRSLKAEAPVRSPPER